MTIPFQPIFFAAALLALAVPPAPAADIGGPVSGYVFDASTGAVRPVLGIPGAATLGDPLDLGFEAAYAAVAPAQDYLLATGADGQVWLARLGAAPTTAARLDTLHGAPQRIVFSPRGSAALLIQSDTADIFTGLPESPSLARTLGLGGIAASAAFAVSDDGSAVLAAAGDSVSVAGSSAEWRVLPGAGADALVAFSPGSRDGAAASRSANTVTLLRNPAESGDSTTIAGPDDGIAGPAGIAFTADGRILVANSDSGTVSILIAGAATTVSCGCSPTGLAPMGAVFRLTDPTDAPMWLLDARRGEPRALFVPALRSASGDNVR